MFEEEIALFKVDDISSSKEVLIFLADQLKRHGIVTDTFENAIIDREKRFPTGLQLDSYGVAIPHADSVYVNRSQIAIMTLKEPVPFQQMSDASLTVSVNLIFMLALKDSKSQLLTLKSLMGLLQKSEEVKEIIALKNTRNSITKLKDILKANSVI